MSSFNSATVTLGTSEGDIFTASSKSLTLLIQAINTSDSSVTCELWLTDGSNTHKSSIIPAQTINAYDGVQDVTKHVVLSGYKIRGKASSTSSIYVEISVLEDVS